MTTSRMTAEELAEREYWNDKAFDRYYRDNPSGDIPNECTVDTIDGEKRVALSNNYRVVAEYRVTEDGLLKEVVSQ